MKFAQVQLLEAPKNGSGGGDGGGGGGGGVESRRHSQCILSLITCKVFVIGIVLQIGQH